jgi:hypothetical protein
MNTNTDIKTTALVPPLQLSGVSKQLAASLAGVGKLSGQIAAQRPLAKWAEEQQKSLTGIQRALIGSVGKPGALGIAASLAKTNKVSGLDTAALFAKQTNLGNLGFNAKDIGVSAALAKSLVGVTPPRYPSDLLEALIKPSTRYHDLARALAPSLRAYRGVSVSPGLAALVRKQAFTFPEVIAAGTDTAALIEDEGGEEEAEAIREIAAEVAVVAATPTTTTVERLATALSAQFEAASARVGEVGAKVENLAERVDDNERQRQFDRNNDTALAFYLWYLALMVEVVRLLLEVAARGH